jgi:hypothetical protein
LKIKPFQTYQKNKSQACSIFKQIEQFQKCSNKSKDSKHIQTEEAEEAACLVLGVADNALVVGLTHAALPLPATPQVQGVGFKVQGVGVRVQGVGFRVQGVGFRVQGVGFRVQGVNFRVQGMGFRVQGVGFRFQGVGFREFGV